MRVRFIFAAVEKRSCKSQRWRWSVRGERHSRRFAHHALIRSRCLSDLAVAIKLRIYIYVSANFKLGHISIPLTSGSLFCRLCNFLMTVSSLWHLNPWENHVQLERKVSKYAREQKKSRCSSALANGLSIGVKRLCAHALKSRFPCSTPANWVMLYRKVQWTFLHHRAFYPNVEVNLIIDLSQKVLLVSTT